MVAQSHFILISCDSEKCKLKFLLELDQDLARKRRQQKCDEWKKAAALNGVSIVMTSYHQNGYHIFLLVKIESMKYECLLRTRGTRIATPRRRRSRDCGSLLLE